MSFQLVVIVDHGSTNLKVLGRLAQSLSEAAAVQTFADADAAVSFCAENAPDLVVAGATGEQVDQSGLSAACGPSRACAKRRSLSSAIGRTAEQSNGRSMPAPMITS